MIRFFDVLRIFSFIIFPFAAVSQNLTISSSGNTGTSGTNWSTSGSNPVRIVFSGTAAVNRSVIQDLLVNDNVVVEAGTGGGNISIISEISWTSGKKLTIEANGTLSINANIINGNGDLELNSKKGDNGVCYFAHDGILTANSVSVIVGNGGSGNITIISDEIAFDGRLQTAEIKTTTINTTGHLTIRPWGTDFGPYTRQGANISSGSVNTSGSIASFAWEGVETGADYTFSNATTNDLYNLIIKNRATLGGLTIGKTGMTKDMVIQNPIAIAGPINIFGGNITIANNINTSAGNANGDILLKASAGITFAKGKTIASNGGDMIFWSDADGSGSGDVFFEADQNTSSSNPVTISTGGGHLWIGGGSNSVSWNGLSVGDGYAIGGTARTVASSFTHYNGITIQGTSITTSGGHIQLKSKGKTGDYNGSSYSGGIYLLGNGLMNSGGGNIEIEALAQSGTGNKYGLYNLGPYTFSPGTGSLTITGTAAASSGGTNSYTGSGIFFWTNVLPINSSGNITLIGNKSSFNGTFGVDIHSVITTTGTLSLQGDEFRLAANVSAGGGTTVSSTSITLGAPITLGDNNIILGANTTITSSSTNYFKTTGTGMLKRPVASGASFNFPVGNSSYNPLTITNNTGWADDFSVRVADEVLDGGTIGTAITDKVLKRTWHIGKTNPNVGSGVNMTFQWAASEQGTNMTDYKLSHFGNAWALAAGTSGTVSVNGSIKTMTHTGYTGTFSPFAIGSSTSVLPVTWLSFTGKKVAQGVELNWSTSSEQNTQDFQVQHSINAQQWAAVGNLPAAGNSNTVRNYQYLHQGPFKISTQHYYRILQRDLDGKFSYSKVIIIEYPEAATDVVLYPNPTNDVLHVNLTERKEIRLVNMQGIVVWKGVLPAGRHEIPVSNFATGNYILQAGKGTYKVMIQ